MVPWLLSGSSFVVDYRKVDISKTDTRLNGRRHGLLNEVSLIIGVRFLA